LTSPVTSILLPFLLKISSKSNKISLCFHLYKTSILWCKCGRIAQAFWIY